MSHLPTERLAALADEPETAAELAHLAVCEACVRERQAYERLLGMARAEQARLGVPLTRWEGIVSGGRRVAEDDTASRDIAGPDVARRTMRPVPRIAAAILFIAAGAAMGRVSAGAPVLPLPGDTAITSASSAVPAAAGDSAAVSFATVDEARLARVRYEALYQNAAAYLAAHDTTFATQESPSAMRTRLAALDRVDRAMRDAMDKAPYDPVINGYYLTTIGQREQTLRQLNTVLPVGMRINSY